MQALEKALLAFHTTKMSDINQTIKELWQKTYRNQDIDYIQARAPRWSCNSHPQAACLLRISHSSTSDISPATAIHKPLACYAHHTARHRTVQRLTGPHDLVDEAGQDASECGAGTNLAGCGQQFDWRGWVWRGAQVKADSEGAGARSYNYRVVMMAGGVELDMRGRCSAGQKARRFLLFSRSPPSTPDPQAATCLLQEVPALTCLSQWM